MSLENLPILSEKKGRTRPSYAPVEIAEITTRDKRIYAGYVCGRMPFAGEFKIIIGSTIDRNNKVVNLIPDGIFEKDISSYAVKGGIQL